MHRTVTLTLSSQSSPRHLSKGNGRQEVSAVFKVWLILSSCALKLIFAISNNDSLQLILQSLETFELTWVQRSNLQSPR